MESVAPELFERLGGEAFARRFSLWFVKRSPGSTDKNASSRPTDRQPRPARA
jgi:hypothetical protein